MTKTTRRRELGLALGKGVVSSIPVVGPIIAEIVGVLIPNYRLNRIEEYLSQLESRIAKLDIERVKLRFHDQNFIDVFEDSMHQASRSLSEERTAHIASIIESSLKEEEVHHEKTKHILNILGEMTDIEILFLQYHGQLPGKKREFFKRHKSLLEPPHPRIKAPQAERESQAMYDAYLNHLVRLGLLRPIFFRPRKGQVPEFDEKTGMMKAGNMEITPLGKLVLRTMGLETLEV